MPKVILQATSNASPDGGLGGGAMTGMSSTGHSSSTASCSSVAFSGFGSDNDQQTKSASWSGFPAGPSSGRVLVQLKVDWAVSGSESASADTGDGGSANADSFFDLEYSINNGSTWNSIRSASAGCNEITSPTSLSDNGPTTITLSTGQDLTQVKVREKLQSVTDAAGGEFSGASSSASTTSSISSLQIEVTTNDAQLIVCA